MTLEYKFKIKNNIPILNKLSEYNVTEAFPNIYYDIYVYNNNNKICHIKTSLICHYIKYLFPNETKIECDIRDVKIIDYNIDPKHNITKIIDQLIYENSWKIVEVSVEDTLLEYHDQTIINFICARLNI